MYQIKNNKILEAIHRGIQLALDDMNNIEDNNSVSGDIINTDDVINNKKEIKRLFVDLGLPSGTLWAKYNLGVNIDVDQLQLINPEDWYGDYYCWGEIETKPEYRPIDYKFIADTTSTYTKYNGELNDKDTLDLCDDAAYVNNPYKKLNVNICLPSADQIIELMNGTIREIAYDYDGVIGLNCMILKSIYNDNELVLPFGGFKQYRELKQENSFGAILSNYMNKAINYQSCVFKYFLRANGVSEIRFEGMTKSVGISVRPVLMK